MRLGPGVRLVYTRGAQSILVEGPPLTLIDTGGPGSLPRLVRAIRRAGHKLDDLEQIVVTHAHAGHLGVAARLRELTGARVLVHPGDEAVARGSRPPYPLASRGVAGVALAPAMGLLRPRLAFAPVEVDGLLQDGQELDPGLEIVATPGHTPGHVSVLIPEALLLHAGDAISNLIGMWPPLAMHTEDEMAVFLSIRRLAERRFRRISFGHGPPVFRDARRRVGRLAGRYKVKGGGTS